MFIPFLFCKWGKTGFYFVFFFFSVFHKFYCMDYAFPTYFNKYYQYQSITKQINSNRQIYISWNSWLYIWLLKTPSRFCLSIWISLHWLNKSTFFLFLNYLKFTNLFHIFIHVYYPFKTHKIKFAWFKKNKFLK